MRDLVFRSCGGDGRDRAPAAGAALHCADSCASSIKYREHPINDDIRKITFSGS
jgi:hypothetical protein